MRRKAATVIAGWAVVTAGALVVGRGAVALPEHCGSAAPTAVSSAVDAAVGWFGHNQRQDGTWLYRYRVTTDEDLGGYSWVRHAGVLLALYQAANARVPSALAIADAGRTAAVDRDLTRGPGWAALQDDGTLTAGGTALFTVALGERRDATGDNRDDALLHGLGTFLRRQVAEDGQVWEVAGLDGTANVGVPSTFTTGEVFFALARLHRLFPGEGFDEPAMRIAQYVMTERADREGFVPDMSDHWSAYAFAEVRRWPSRAATGLTPDELGFARRQLGIMSIQTRYETQRTNRGITVLLRGHQSQGAGTGTVGEAMGQWWQVGTRERALDGRLADLRVRVTCLAGAIIARQTAPGTAAGPSPARADGAWFAFGVTQMDDQQHSLSALLGARAVLADPTPLPRRSPIPTNVWVLVLAVLAALNPLRLAAGASGDRRRRTRSVAVAGSVAVAASGLLAAFGGPLLRALDVSTGNGLVAAGVVLVGGGLYCLADPSEGLAVHPRESDSIAPAGLLVPLVIPLALRPDLLLTAIAVGAGGRGWLLTGTVAVGVVLAVGYAALDRRPSPIVHRWLMRVVGTLAVATALALVVDGVYAV